MKQTPEQKLWREGYDLGYKNALDDKKIALSIGEAILAALDERYEFKEKDY